MCDHLGSVRDVINTGGTVLNHIEYNAFGKLTNKSSANNVPTFRYTGKLTDDSTDLQWNINRWYDANVGRWVSEDPIGFVAGDVNLYRYVRNHSSWFLDPLGLILLAIDGTWSEYWLEGGQFGIWDNEQKKVVGRLAKTHNNRWLSHVRNFHNDYYGTEKKYLHGPQKGMYAADLNEIIQKGYKWVCAMYKSKLTPDNNKKKIDLVGHSRGGIAVMEVARMLENKGCDIQDENNKVCKIRVRFVGLYDPVVGHKNLRTGYTYKKQKPNNIDCLRIAVAGPFLSGKKISRSTWTRLSYSASGNEISKFAATHGGIGGAPTYDTEEFGALDDKGNKIYLSAGSMPPGYTPDKDIDGSIATDKWIRQEAQKIRVPIPDVGSYTRADYGFDKLPAWDPKHQVIPRTKYATSDE